MPYVVEPVMSDVVLHQSSSTARLPSQRRAETRLSRLCWFGSHVSYSSDGLSYSHSVATQHPDHVDSTATPWVGRHQVIHLPGERSSFHALAIFHDLDVVGCPLHRSNLSVSGVDQVDANMMERPTSLDHEQSTSGPTSLAKMWVRMLVGVSAIVD
jgi:hypothetical protein